MTLILVARPLCRQAVACPRTFFAERLTPLVEPWAPLTTRLCQALAVLGLASGGEGKTRLAAQLAI